MSVPETWRMTRSGCTRRFQAEVVAELPNPGEIVEFHGQLYRIEDGKLAHCSPGETRKARETILFKNVEDKSG